MTPEQLATENSLMKRTLEVLRGMVNWPQYAEELGIKDDVVPAIMAARIAEQTLTIIKVIEQHGGDK